MANDGIQPSALEGLPGSRRAPPLPRKTLQALISCF